MSVLDNVMDGAMDASTAAPELINPPTGSYLLMVTKVNPREVDTDKGTVAVVDVTYQIEEVLELASSDEAEPETGSIFTESFWLNEKGLPFFTRYCVNIFGDDINGLSTREVLDSLEHRQLKAKVVTRERNGFTNSNTRNQEAV